LEIIELTDKLIDQIVYKLYGLTEEEIRVVEERQNQWQALKSELTNSA
jgi:hypothetical protein